MELSESHVRNFDTPSQDQEARKQAATESLPYYSTRLKYAPELVSALDRFVTK